MNSTIGIWVGGLAHETHTFSAASTPVDAFHGYEWASGNNLLTTYQGTRTSLGGILAGAEGTNASIVPGFYTFAIPSGLVPERDYRDLHQLLLANLTAAVDAGQVDAVILVCHGAMVAAGFEDVEADLAQQVRAIIGPDRPLAMTVDFHANVSAALVETVDFLDGYDTYPHVDVYERGFETVRAVVELIETGTGSIRAFATVPILAVPQRQNTDTEPMRSLLARVHEIEQSDTSVRSISLLGGFCYSDVARAGMAIVVQTRDDSGRARQYATELQQLVWARREEFVQTNVPVADAVAALAHAPSDRPAILVDVADNIGGGAPGDGTALLAEILRRDISGVVIAIADRDAVASAWATGVGGQFHGSVGGKTDQYHGSPVEVTGRVKLLSDGQFIYRGSYMTGQTKEMGRTAVIDVQGNDLIISELKTMPFDQQQLRSVGVSPEYCRAIVVKSATAWRAAYESLAGTVIDVDTPGICTVSLATLDYRNLARPIFPLDDSDDIALSTPSVFGSRTS